MALFHFTPRCNLLLLLGQQLFRLLLQCIHYVLTILFAQSEFIFLFSFCYQNNNLAIILSSCSPKSLYHSGRRSKTVITDNKIYVTYIQSFLSHACSYQSVNFPLFEFLNHLPLYLLTESVVILANKHRTLDCILIIFI